MLRITLPGSGRAQRLSSYDKKSFLTAGVQIFDIAIFTFSPLDLVRKTPRPRLKSPAFPFAHLRWVKLALGYNLLDWLVATRRF